MSAICLSVLLNTLSHRSLGHLVCYTVQTKIFLHVFNTDSGGTVDSKLFSVFLEHIRKESLE